MNKLILTAFLLVPLPLLAVDGDGKAATETRDVAAFQGLDVGGAYTVVITAGEKPQVKISTDANLIPLIQTTVEEGVLKVTSSDDMSPSGKLELEITAPGLASIDISGAVSLKAAGITAPTFEVSASGAGALELEGKTTELRLEMSGAGSIDAEKLLSSTATVEVSGAGSVRVHATEKLTARVSGAASVHYAGKPKTVEEDISGVGSLKPIE